MGDKYDDAIKYLTEHPDKIEQAWFLNTGHPAHCLFQFLTPDGKPDDTVDEKDACGCPTLVQTRDFRGYTRQLTVAVRKNRQIPDSIEAVTVESLSAFAEIQRLADKVLGRMTNEQP